MCTAFKKTVQQQKWMVPHLNFSDKLDIILSDFTPGESRSGSNGSYRAKLGLISAEWIIESNSGTQYIQGGGIVTGKKNQKSYHGELRGQLGVMCDIKIMKSIFGITILVLNSCGNIIILRRATIHPESVKSRWKHVDLISCLSDVYQSMDSIMSLVQVHGNHISRMDN